MFILHVFPILIENVADVASSTGDAYPTRASSLTCFVEVYINLIAKFYMGLGL